ncbi:MAG: GatB/YqeY domain-containing protein [Gemmatimonadetes bacterium]|nr:GatB/YqeY domain-containing protein [Gemmatimonadota bacterium]MEC7807559.1 GatB/YqeY domain-containing protein [Gemmatimonadota bacterium]
MRSDLTSARKDRDKLRTLVLSTLLADVHNREIELGAELSDDQTIQVLSRGIKQRKDAASQMRAAGRDELANGEEAQLTVLSEYLPEGMSEDEVRALVRAAIEDGVDQMGMLMGRVMPQIRGRYDGKEANRIVREELGR